MTEQNIERKHVAIIGAGITGLSAAYHLQQAGHSAVIFEKSSRIGGAIQSSSKEGFLYEHGPNSLMVNDKRVENLIHQADLSSKIQVANKAAHKRFVVHKGKLNTLPSSPASFVTSSLFSLKAKLRLAKEPFIAKRAADAGGESFADFIRRRLGPEILEKAAAPFVNGIYAGDPNRLSTNHAFPRLFALEQGHGSLIKGIYVMMREIKKGKGDSNRMAKRKIISFKDGMESLPKGIASKLQEGSIFLDTKLGNIFFNKKTKCWHIDWKVENGATGQGCFDDVIITVPAHKLENLPLEGKVLDAISRVPHLDYPPVAAMTLGFKRSQISHPLDGFGMLNALNEKSKLLGALFTSTLFPGRAPDDCVAINIMLGGSRTPEHAKMSESAMKASVMDELRRLLGIEGNPFFSSLVRWEKAIPQANIGYSSILEQLEQCERKFSGIHFAGNYRGGISVGDCIVSGIKLTEKISSK
ncbi:MAG: protoporphyrinogen oxidase [Rubritalea sp.]|uniref:protoporphyrinogen oxidase n=1 Tax=Rubritalea sp. TaxID=2109375 RepID=UPI0032428DA2